MGTSQFQDKVQRAAARRIFHYSDRRVPFGSHGLGDSQAHAVPFAGCDLWWIRCDARLAFLAHVVLRPFCRTPRGSGLRRWVGYVRGMITGWSAKVMRPEVTADEH